MNGLFWLVRKQWAHEPWRSGLLLVCIGATLLIPLLGARLMQRYGTDLRTRAEATPLVLGERGNRFDLCLGALFFRKASLRPVTYGEAQRWTARRDGIAVPLHLGHSVQGAPLVGVTPEYFEQRGLRLGEGQWVTRPGEILLGAQAQHTLGAKVGDRLRSDPPQGFGIGGPSTQDLRVVGVLERSWNADDDAVFAALSTAWLLDGHLHGHDSAEELRESQPAAVLAEEGQRTMLSGAVVPDQNALENDPGRMHLHGQPEHLPVSAVLLWPQDEMTRTLIAADVNAQGTLHMLRPEVVIEELMAKTLRVKTLIDRLVWILGLGMGLLFALVCVQSARLRAAEWRTLRRMGVAPGYCSRLLAVEIAGLALGAGVLAFGLAWFTARWIPHLVQVL